MVCDLRCILTSGQGNTDVSGLERRCWQVLDTQCGLALQTSLVQSLCLDHISSVVQFH